MTAKLKNIIEQLNVMVTFNVDKSMTDDDFIANVDAINLLCNLFDAALSACNVAELSKLLTLAPYWNIDPTVRHRLTEAIIKAQSMDGLSLPERRVNPIAADIFTRIDNITGKYEGVAQSYGY